MGGRGSRLWKCSKRLLAGGGSKLSVLSDAIPIPSSSTQYFINRELAFPFPPTFYTTKRLLAGTKQLTNPIPISIARFQNPLFKWWSKKGGGGEGAPRLGKKLLAGPEQAGLGPLDILNFGTELHSDLCSRKPQETPRVCSAQIAAYPGKGLAGWVGRHTRKPMGEESAGVPRGDCEQKELSNPYC